MNSNIDTAAAGESWDLVDRSLPVLITASVTVLLFNKQQPRQICDEWSDVFILWLISHTVTEVITLLTQPVSVFPKIEE